MASAFTMMNDAIIRNDVWIPMTIRVAWDLHMAKIEIRPNILMAARIHVLSHLGADISVEQAEIFTGVYTQDFILRYKEQRYQRPHVLVDMDQPFAIAHREALLEGLDRICHRVFWYHYSDGFALERVSQKVGKPLRSVESICKMLRKRLRKIGEENALPISGWTDERIDQSIRYLGSLASEIVHDFEELGTDAGKKYTRKCPRLRRAHYLLRSGILSMRDLEVPEDNQFVERKQMLALLLHPDARKYTGALRTALEEVALPLDTQGFSWLVDVNEIDEAEEALISLAHQGTPEREYLRGAIVSGPGMWLEDTFVGPLPLQCLDAARSRPWGSIDGVSELPLPLPPPPKMTKWWVSAASSVLLLLSSIAWALDASGPQAHFPLIAEFDSHVDFVDVRFDVSDRAYVSIVQRKGGILQVESEWTPSSKGKMATGDGRFIHRVDASQIIVISTEQPIEGLETLLQAAQVDSDPVDAVEQHVLAKYPHADILVSPLAQVQ